MYVIRLQILLLELIFQGYINFHEPVLSMAIQTSSEKDKNFICETFKYAWEDLKLWLGNLYTLLNKEITFPVINLESSADIVVDIDLYNNYDETLFDEDGVIRIRNDYFPYAQNVYVANENKAGNTYAKSKFCQYKNYYTVATSDLRFFDVSPTDSKHKGSLEFFLKNIFGHEGFRPNQLEIVANGLNPNYGVVGLLPTGSGKSVCYQLVSFLTPGITLVISPLKLLMDDQTTNLYQRNLIMTSFSIHGDKRENIVVFSQKQAKLVYITPEKFFNDAFNKLIHELPIGQIVIDEVHCLSEWGHDFRTSYLLLLSFLKELPKNVLLMGTSATASPRVINDIEKEFSKIKPNNFKRIQATSIKRPELTFEVKRADCEKNAKNILCGIVGKNIRKAQKTLVFCAYKKEADNLAGYLNKFNYNARKYYSDYVAEQKEIAFEDFSNGNSKVMVATKAFGMGIDISDVRETVHYDIASSVESLYQEMGRAGRDQKNSKCSVILTQCESQKKNIDKLFAREMSINQLKWEQMGNFDGEKGDKWLVKYGPVGKQLCLLLKDNSDYISWGDFVYSVYLFLQGKNDSKNFFLSEFQTFWKEKYPDAQNTESSELAFNKALYKLFTLGIINLWGLSYSNGIKNPQYLDIVIQDLSGEEIQNNLINYIRKYDFRYEYISGNTIIDYITALCKWDNETFLHYRWESLKTLYYMLLEFTTSEEFADRIENFFIVSDDLTAIVSNPDSTCADCIPMLFEISSNILKDQLANLSAETRNNRSIDFMQGMIAIKDDDLSKLKEQNFKRAISEEMEKNDCDNERFVENCLAYFESGKSAQKRFLVFIADNFPEKFKHKEIKKALKNYDEEIVTQLVDRPQYNKIYASLKELKQVLGGSNDKRRYSKKN